MKLHAFFKEIHDLELEYAVETMSRRFSAWNRMLIFPTLNYIEVMILGPIPIAQIKYIHIFVVQKQDRGERLLTQFIHRKNEIEKALDKFSIPFVQHQEFVISIDLNEVDSYDLEF